MRNIFRTLLNTRSRKARSRPTRFQYNRALFFAPIGLALLLIFLFTQNVEVLASVWRDPLSVLAARSPGQRDAGALYNIKHKRRGLAHAGPTGIAPHERVLAATRMRPEPFPPGALPDDLPLADLLSDQPVGMIGPDALPATGSTGGFGPSGGAPFGGVPLFSAGSPAGPTSTSEILLTDIPTGDTPTGDTPPGGNPPGGNPPGGNPPDVTAAVPEPSTWLMNIVGLFAIAGVMRRNKRRQIGPVRTFTA
jgi:hypothetical protein